MSDTLRFCPCGYSWEDGDLSDPMKWHRDVGIHETRIERRRLERVERLVDSMIVTGPWDEELD